MASEPATVDRAREILRGAPLVDGHNDLFWQLRKRVWTPPTRTRT